LYIAKSLRLIIKAKNKIKNMIISVIIACISEHLKAYFIDI
jgi:hypothetical protein